MPAGTGPRFDGGRFFGYGLPMTSINSTDGKVEAYYDNGTDVGRCVDDRLSTRGSGELLATDNAATFRQWFERLLRQARDATHDVNGLSR